MKEIQVNDKVSPTIGPFTGEWGRVVATDVTAGRYRGLIAVSFPPEEHNGSQNVHHTVVRESVVANFAPWFLNKREDNEP